MLYFKYIFQKKNFFFTSDMYNTVIVDTRPKSFRAKYSKALGPYSVKLPEYILGGNQARK